MIFLIIYVASFIISLMWILKYKLHFNGKLHLIEAIVSVIIALIPVFNSAICIVAIIYILVYGLEETNSPIIFRRK